jgi:hypothetical protein
MSLSLYSTGVSAFNWYSSVSLVAFNWCQCIQLVSPADPEFVSHAQEVKHFLDANPEEIVILYLDTKFPPTPLQAAKGNSDMLAVFGDAIFLPGEGDPRNFTIRQLLNMGKRVIVEDHEDGWLHPETGPVVVVRTDSWQALIFLPFFLNPLPLAMCSFARVALPLTQPRCSIDDSSRRTSGRTSLARRNSRYVGSTLTILLPEEVLPNVPSNTVKLTFLLQEYPNCTIEGDNDWYGKKFVRALDGGPFTEAAVRCGVNIVSGDYQNPDAMQVCGLVWKRC